MGAALALFGWARTRSRTPMRRANCGGGYGHIAVTGMGGGNHRGSSFRLCVGQAILERDHHSCRSWAVGRMAATAARRFGVTSAEILRDERPIEEKVSAVICAMSILWLPIDDAPGPDSKRADIERNSTALLSNYNPQREPLDPPSKGWLGQHSPNERVCRSGLWSLGLRR